MTSDLMVRRLVATGLVALAGLGLSGCGGGGGGGTSPPPSGEPLVASRLESPAVAGSVVIDGKTEVAAAQQVLVLFDEDVTPAEYQDVLARAQALGATRFAFDEDLRLLQVILAVGTSELEVAGQLATLDGVTAATLNFVTTTERPNPPLARDPGALAVRPRERPAAISTEGRYWVDQIDLATAWTIETAAGVTSGPRLAIVDTGLRDTQNVIAEGRLTRLDGLGNPLASDSTPSPVNHGQYVAAFAAGSSADASGVSRFSSVLSVDVYNDECGNLFSLLGCPVDLGRVFITDLANGLKTALDSSATVVNVSWGDASQCSDPAAVRLRARQEFRQVMAAAVNLARRRDKLVVFSAGNNCEKRDDQLLVAADAPGADSWDSHALVVAASDESATDALFSRMGAVVDLAAPGAQVGYGGDRVDGTSFSASMVSGVAGILQGIAPGLSAPETRALIVGGAEPRLGFSDAAGSPAVDYTGSNAATPTLLLNAGNAARSARLARDVSLTTLPAQSLALNATGTASFEVQIPTTGVSAMDVVFLIDVSASYGDDIATLRSRAAAIVDSLLARGIDVQFGVAQFSDFPSPFEDAGDTAYQRLLRVGSDRDAVIDTFNALTLQSGGDDPESQLEALYQVATGEGRAVPDGPDLPPEAMGFRVGAARLVLLATDADFHDSDVTPSYPGAGYAETVAALRRQGIAVIGLQSGDDPAAAVDLNRIAADTGGSVFQLATDSAQIAEAIVAGVNAAVAEVDVTIETLAGAEWIQSIEPPQVLAARPGDRLSFTVNLQGRRRASIDRLSYDSYLWVKGNGGNLLARVKIPIQVPE